eukprot:8562054-Ditylum_brightwellii.AAC.1
MYDFIPGRHKQNSKNKTLPTYTSATKRRFLAQSTVVSNHYHPDAYNLPFTSDGVSRSGLGSNREKVVE